MVRRWALTPLGMSLARAGDVIGSFRCLLSGETQNSSKRPFSQQAAAGSTGWAIGTAGWHTAGQGGLLPT